MLRISVVTNADATTVKLEGKLLRPWCDEVLRACRGASATGQPVRLDLYDVDYVDHDGFALVRSLRDVDGVVLSRCSNFVAELLHTEPVCTRRRLSPPLPIPPLTRSTPKTPP